MPPLTGDAVKVTGEPVQDVTVVGVMLTDGAAPEVIVTVTVLLVALGVEAHDALLVITTETTSLLLSVDEVNVDPVWPEAATPFTNHR